MASNADLEGGDTPKRRYGAAAFAGAGAIGLKAIGLLKLGKIGGSALTMLLSIASYALVFGWRYATGFVGLLLLHEGGHYLAARQRGLPVSLPTFIPFIGAWINLQEQPMDVETEAYVAAGGPVIGSLAALAVYLFGLGSGSSLLLALSYSGFMLNFFNLIPISPLDGGRMTAIISPRVWFIGAPIMVALAIWRPSPLLITIAILAIPSLIKAWEYDPSEPELARYYQASIGLKLRYGLLYLALLAALALLATSTHQHLYAITGH